MVHGLPDFWRAHNLRPTPTADLAVKEKPLKAGEEITLIDVKIPGKLYWLELNCENADVAWTVALDDAVLGPVYPAPTPVFKHLTLVPREWRDQIADVGVGEGIILTKYDTTNRWFTFLITLPVQWSERFSIIVKNYSTVETKVRCSACYAI